jgi:UDP-N-acetylmuramoylalanine--D-glutamate ligase
MKIAIVGFGKQGRAAYDYWRQGNEITICDADGQLSVPDDVQQQLGPDYLKDIGRFDLIVRSPIIHPRELVAAAGDGILGKVTTVTNEFFRVCPTSNIIGVTGTKGKGTTSTLIARMLDAGGKRVHLGGNIGTPPLDLLHNDIKPEDWVVLELANFQLIDLKYSPPIAVCLMVHPEHLDWHKDIEEYIEAKSQLFRHQTAEDTAIYYADNQTSKRIASTSPGRQLPYMAEPGALVKDGSIMIDGQTICRTDELKLLGRHNWQNVCAAVTAVWQISQDVPALRSVLTSFAGLEHRLEFVRKIGNILYYNDSFGTTPETAIAAIEAFPNPQVVIIGGRGKGVSFAPLAKALKETKQVAKVLLIGETQAEIAGELDKAGFDNYGATNAKNMPEIVTQATGLAREISDKDDVVVLLSAASTSFDMFKNYEDRGIRFKQAVQSLA